ncbi:MAG: hypothetical protein CNCCGFBP_01658 [Fimbriimonadaceae bacterium]|nr:hypothetical protein [Fimbriimonadaceae bacterium]
MKVSNNFAAFQRFPLARPRERGPGGEGFPPGRSRMRWPRGLSRRCCLVWDCRAKREPLLLNL